MGTKRVLLDQTIEFPSGTDRKAQFTAFNVEPTRAEVEAQAFGDKSQKYEVGLANHSFSATVRPDADQAFRKYLMQRMEDGADVPVVHRPKNAVKGSDNPEVTFSVKVHMMPPIGGDHGALEGEGNLNLTINGPVTWDDGTDTVTIG